MPVKISKQFYGAYCKGRAAFEKYGKAATCPYPDIMTGRHMHVITFSRAFRKFWVAGFEDMKTGNTRYEAKTT